MFELFEKYAKGTEKYAVLLFLVVSMLKPKWYILLFALILFVSIRDFNMGMLAAVLFGAIKLYQMSAPVPFNA